MNAGRLLGTLGLLVAVGLGALFTIQNSGRTSDLSLDLGFYAVHLAAPQPLPHLLWVAFAAGLLLGGGWGILQWNATRGRIRDLEQRLTRASVRKSDDTWT